ncbi:MAG: cation:proton antiporter [Alphaproteobacteria bacterium]|nr:cation:proton antiporter [Alphaproteobacteria bacterium]
MSLSVFIFFAIIFVLVFLLRTARIGALVAFLVAGIISGPYVLNLFQIDDTWRFLGDLGILFLWFNIGLEINMKRLWQMRRTIFGFGAAQVMMVAVMLFPILVGVTTWSVLGVVTVSLLLAMSSTSEDLQLLTDRNQLNTEMGHQTFSILLFQDLLSIPLLAMLPVLAGRSFNLGATVIDVLVTSLTLIFGVVVVGRLIMNPLLRLVSKLKSREAFLLVIMLNIVAWAIVMDYIGLPAGLGAFLAGMLMSETIYNHQIKAEITPYALLFLSLFFISLGMGLNLDILLSNWYMVVFGMVGLVLIKFSALFIVARVRNVNATNARLIALLLSQGGEFGLLMFQTMKTSGIEAVPAAHQEILTAIIILSMVSTPFLLAIYDVIQKSKHVFVRSRKKQANTEENLVKPAVVICGFGRVGQIIAHILRTKNIPYVALDLSVNAVMMGRESGYNVFYGDSTNESVLREFGLSARNVKAVVVALDNTSTARNAVLTVKSVAPKVKIFARARNLVESRALIKEGVKEAWPETIESSLMLARGVLGQLGVSDANITNTLTEMRAENYSELDNAISDKHS